jgi:hypothetical protein
MYFFPCSWPIRASHRPWNPQTEERHFNQGELTPGKVRYKEKAPFIAREAREFARAS